MNVPAFNEKELKITSMVPAQRARPEVANFSYPVTPKAAQRAAFERKAIWQMIGTETQIFNPRALPDNVARSYVYDSLPFDPNTDGGGKDMFGIDWIYDPAANGSMVKPGTPLFTDANDWREKLMFPDIETWNWDAGLKENNENYLASDMYNVSWIFTGWFERLISFMDFEDASIALIDESQQEAVKELFEEISKLYIRIIDKCLELYVGIDGFLIHDDWGSQQSTFFAPKVAEEMIVPYMKMVTDHIHSKGLFAELHSCGSNIAQVPNFIAAGWDAWNPQGEINDTQKMYELYGDQLVIGVMPDQIKPDAPAEEQRAVARDYADRFCRPAKPSMLNKGAAEMLTPMFWETLYRQSRINYSS